MGGLPLRGHERRNKSSRARLQRSPAEAPAVAALLAQALAFYERAVARLEPEEASSVLAPLLVRIGRVETALGRWDDALAALERALELVEREGSPAERAAVQRTLAETLDRAGRDPERSRALQLAAGGP